MQLLMHGVCSRARNLFVLTLSAGACTMHVRVLAILLLMRSLVQLYVRELANLWLHTHLVSLVSEVE